MYLKGVRTVSEHTGAMRDKPSQWEDSKICLLWLVRHAHTHTHTH